MCIIFIAKNVHPEFPLIIAANRDEFLLRPTQSPDWWPDAPHVFAGKDLQAGGTWLGYNRQGRMAGITNLRQPSLHQSGAKSRGDLVKRFLDINAENTKDAVTEYTAFLKSSYQQYNPFNLLYGDMDELRIFSSATGEAESLEDGIHGLSNGVPKDIWPKMQRGIDEMAAQIESCVDAESFFSILGDSVQTTPDQLPNNGIPVEKEQSLSSIFIPEFDLQGQRYGTRSSSVMCFERNTVGHDVSMVSRIYGAEPE